MADWIELELSLTDRRSVTDALVVRIDETIEDDMNAGRAEWDEDAKEDLDREILDDPTEKRRTDMWDELALRQDELGNLYPFVLSRKGATGWQLTRREATTIEIAVAHSVYDSTLVMASFRHGHIRKQSQDDPLWKKLEKQIAEHLQYLASHGAAMLLGEAYSFGWPRPSKSRFRDAVVDAISCLGLGKVREEFPLDSTGLEKDGTVDVIAWRAFKDRTYGALVLYGQVASGANWNSKPIYTYLEEKFLRYLDPRPSMHYIGATFMPFVLHTEVADPAHGNMEGAIRDRAVGLEMTHGTIVDRVRLTELLGDGLPEEDRLHNCPNLSEVLESLATWVKGCRDYCELAA